MAKRRALALMTAWAPTVLYMALIWGLSSIRIRLPVVEVPFKDKGLHFVEFAVLGFFAAHAVHKTWHTRPLGRVYWTAVIVAFGWGILDEFHQAFVPGRDGDVYDVLADGLGAMAGAAALIIFVSVRVARRTRGNTS